MTGITQSPIVGARPRRASPTVAASPRGGIVSAVLAVVVLLIGLFGSASAASAHDTVESTSPVDGSTVTTAPEQITVTLNNTPGALGSAISVKDSAGTEWAQGPVAVLDRTVTEQLKPGAPAGKFTVLWRIASSDSHPIEGTFTFTATAAAGGGGAGGASAGTQVPIVPPTDSATPAAVPAVSSADGIPWAVIVMIVVLVALVAGLAITAKRRLNKTD
ncbi:copper resistance CopC family protein [Arthrobacter sp. H14-L1]|uniref:copper resistance CopC family protein n=1 Tax=Arthrobacter sp. H14-L1 TaxID=2996697 RepID=UPI00226FAE68|nr:copper resistance CopC family protein [Arthrobacter sp. H14-L1]MCY0904105.1 copper resistance protein CopC [Arthrobacter sp. H14-L1]